MTFTAKTALADVCASVQYGYTASASENPCGPHFLRITDIVPDAIDWDSVPYCPINDKDKERFSLAVGDIVVARTGATVGYAKLIREPVDAVFASYLVRFRVDERMAVPAYVGRLVESHVYKAFVKSRIGGAAQPNVSAPVLGSFTFSLPSAREQERIASILSAYDDLIANNRRRIKLLEDAARLLYREWFVRLRFPSHEHAKIRDGIPEGWEKKTANDVMDVLSGGTPKTTNSAYWDGNIPFFTPKDSSEFAYVATTEKMLTEEGLRNCNSKLYPKDTVFITARGTVGKINLAQTAMAMNQSCYALAARPPINQFFLYFALVNGVEQFRSRASGAVFDAIVCDTFKLIPFILPEPRLIEMFTDFVTPMLRQVDILSIQIKRLQSARDLLLPKLMSGEIAV